MTVVILEELGDVHQPVVLQWVHGPRTVVMRRIESDRRLGKQYFNGSAASLLTAVMHEF
jgi:hypothetical protein